MTVAFADFMLPKDSLSQRTLFQQAFIRAQPHSSAHLLDPDQVAQLENDWMLSFAVEFCGVRAVQPANIPCKFYAGALHSQADPKKRGVRSPRVAYRSEHP